MFISSSVIETEKTIPISVVMDILKYVEHKSWRCDQKCNCGLNKLLEENGLLRDTDSENTSKSD
jgi:hypothetical protein